MKSLGRFYELGLIGEKNKSKATELYEKSKYMGNQ